MQCNVIESRWSWFSSQSPSRHERLPECTNFALPSVKAVRKTKQQLEVNSFLLCLNIRRNSVRLNKKFERESELIMHNQGGSFADKLFILPPCHRKSLERSWEINLQFVFHTPLWLDFHAITIISIISIPAELPSSEAGVKFRTFFFYQTDRREKNVNKCKQTSLTGTFVNVDLGTQLFV